MLFGLFLLALASFTLSTPIGSLIAAPLNARDYVISPNTSTRHTRFPFLSRGNSNHYKTSINISAVKMGELLVADLTIGNRTFGPFVDTGSADMWVAVSDFECFNVQSEIRVNQSKCATFEGYIPSPTFHGTPDMNFNITYSDVEFLNSVVGTYQITLGAITVYDQTISIVQYTS
jgi:Eukaryotic aspartyl protease